MSGELKLQFVIEAVDRATTKVRAVQAAVDRTTAPLTRMAEGVKNVGTKIAALAEEAGMSKVKAGFDAVAEKIQKLPMIAAISLAGVVALVASTERKLEEAVRGAVRLGMPTAQFQALGFAAKQAGVGPEELGHGMQHLARSMLEAKGGSAEALKVFHAVGVPLAKLKTARVSDVMMAIADKFERAGDRGQNAEKKLAILFALLGRAGPELKGFFDQGSSGIKRFMGEATALGMTIGEKDAAGVLQFAQSMNRLTGVIDGMMARIVVRLNPALTVLLAKLTSDQAKSGDTIVDVVSRALDSLIQQVPKFIKMFGGLSKAVLQLFQSLDWLAGAVGGWDRVFAAFALTLGVKMVMSLYALLPPIWALGVALMTTPFGWVVMSLAAIGVAAVKIWENWDRIVAKFREAFGWIDKIANSDLANILKAHFGTEDQRKSARPVDAGNFFTRHFGGEQARQEAWRTYDAQQRAEGATWGGEGRNRLGGTLTIQIEGPGRVRDLRSEPGSPMDIQVQHGLTLSHP